MTNIARYLTHPQVLIEPLKDIRAWSLNEVGSNRVAILAAQLGSLSRTQRVVSSDEIKALETAKPLALALGVAMEVRPRMHENDRSATGFLPPQEFEAVADQFFAEPAKSVRGWETAESAQRRVVAEVESCLSDQHEGDILFVGHGGVGTLLFLRAVRHRYQPTLRPRSGRRRVLVCVRPKSPEPTLRMAADGSAYGRRLGTLHVTELGSVVLNRTRPRCEKAMAATAKMQRAPPHANATPGGKAVAINPARKFPI